MTRRLAAWLMLIAAAAMIIAGASGYDLRAGLIAAGVLLLLILFGPDVA